MTNPKLIPIDEEDVARLQLIRDHEGNDLSPNDAALLTALADRFDSDSAISVEEAKRHREYALHPNPADIRGCAFDRKLNAFIERGEP